MVIFAAKTSLCRNHYQKSWFMPFGTSKQRVLKLRKKTDTTSMVICSEY